MREAAKVAQHRHCQVCGAAVPPEEMVCSEECQHKYDAYRKRRRRWNYVFIGMIVLLFALFFLVPMFGGG